MKFSAVEAVTPFIADVKRLFLHRRSVFFNYIMAHLHSNVLTFLDLSLPLAIFSHLVLFTEIIRAERLSVVDLTSHSAVLQWRPVLSADSGFYELWYNSMLNTNTETRQNLPGGSSFAELTNLQPDTTYTASLRPESNERLFNTLSVIFTTLPGERI